MCTNTRILNPLGQDKTGRLLLLPFPCFCVSTERECQRLSPCLFGRWRVSIWQAGMSCQDVCPVLCVDFLCRFSCLPIHLLALPLRLFLATEITTLLTLASTSMDQVLSCCLVDVECLQYVFRFPLRCPPSSCVSTVERSVPPGLRRITTSHA